VPYALFLAGNVLMALLEIVAENVNPCYTGEGRVATGVAKNFEILI